MSAFDEFREMYHRIFKGGQDKDQLKLLNVGSDNPNEYHWRFRTASGQILKISLTKEP